MSRLLMRRAFGVVVSGLLVLTPGIAAQKPSGPQGESYASIATLPDWSGAWVRPFSEFEAELILARDPQDQTVPACDRNTRSCKLPPCSAWALPSLRTAPPRRDRCACPGGFPT